MTFKIEKGGDDGLRGFGIILDLNDRSGGFLFWKWAFIVELS